MSIIEIIPMTSVSYSMSIMITAMILMHGYIAMIQVMILILNTIIQKHDANDFIAMILGTIFILYAMILMPYDTDTA